MSILRRILPALFLLTLALPAAAQTFVYRDSAGFDDAHARLREIDFEDVYSVTVANILFRNPYGLHSVALELPDEEGNYPDTADIMLDISQGATLDFPTRTRTVVMTGGANEFELVLTDFDGNVTIHPLDAFPLAVTVPTGIARLQFVGTDGNGNNDINWRGTLTSVTTLDENGDTLGFTDFQELDPDKFYLLGEAHDSFIFGPDSSQVLPKTWHGVTFTDSILGFQGTHLSYFEARVDPDNPIGNLSLEMAPGATIDMPAGVEGALITLEGVKERDTLFFEVTSNDGTVDTVMETGWGRPYDTNWVPDQRVTYLHLGFSSPTGIRQIRYLIGWIAEITGDPDAGFPWDTAYYERTAILSTLHLAESVPAEIAAMRGFVDELDTTGYVGDDASGQLRTPLNNAIVSVGTGDRAGAIAQLQEYRNQVTLLRGSGQLAPEEVDTMDSDAAYVISRLTAAAGVDRESRPASFGISEVRVDRESASFEFTRTVDGSLTIVDITGRSIRALDVAGQVMTWDLRNATGSRVPAGTYIAVVESNGERVSQTIVVR